MYFDYFAHKAAALTQADYVSAASALAYPSLIYRGPRLIVLSNPGQTVRALKAYRTALCAQGYVRTEAHVTDKMVSAAGTQTRNWVTWTHLDQTGEVLRTVDTCHYCSGIGEDVKTMMVDILSPLDAHAGYFNAASRAT